MRAFIAIPIPQDIKRSGADTQAVLKNRCRMLSGWEQDNYHITMKFLR